MLGIMRLSLKFRVHFAFTISTVWLLKVVANNGEKLEIKVLQRLNIYKYINLSLLAVTVNKCDYTCCFI